LVLFKIVSDDFSQPLGHLSILRRKITLHILNKQRFMLDRHIGVEGFLLRLLRVVHLQV